MKEEVILVVDDMDINRAILHDLFKDSYTIVEAENGQEALKQIEIYKDHMAAVLLDIVMPVMDGFEVLRVLSQNKLLSHFPVILITGDTSKEAAKKAYEFGIADMITKPFEPQIVTRRVRNTVDLYQYKSKLEHMVTEQTKILKAQSLRLKDTNARIIDTISLIIEYRNMESRTHISRTREFTRILATAVSKYYPEYELTNDMIDVIVDCSALHDIGKLMIPDNILLKPAKLTADEFEVMKSHTTKGCEIMESMSKLQDKEYVTVGKDICRYHHERYDGSGYPDGLKGDGIPIAAQIVSIVDVYEALVNEKIYKSAVSRSTAYIMIQEGECGVFSPKILECFKIVRGDFETLLDAAQ